MIGLREAAQQINRLDGLPYFAALSEAGYKELYTALAQEARSEAEAESAITALLSDAARAGSAETNRVPSPGEVRLWVRAQREDQYDTPAPVDSRKGCGRVIDAWRDPDGEPARCVNGWIRRREWREIRGIVDEQGAPLYQPYDYSGRCRCQDGGWV